MKFSKQLRFIFYLVSLEAIYCLFYDFVSITGNLSVADLEICMKHIPSLC